MEKVFRLYFMALLAALVAGCGDDGASASSKAEESSLMEQGDLDSVIKRGVAAIADGDVAAASAAADAAIGCDPESAEARLLAGQAAYLEEVYDRARAEFAAVANEASLPAAVRSKGYAGLGLVEYRQNNKDVARILFLHAHRLDSKNESAYYHLGLIYRDTYHFNEAALEQFRMFARLSKPGEPITENVVRKVVPELRNLIQNIAAQRPGVSTRDANAAAKYIERARALVAKNYLTKAKAEYAAALKADPLSYTAAIEYANLLNRKVRGDAEIDRALAAFRAAIDQRPEVQKNYLAAAQLAYSNKRWATAAQILDRAVAHDPKNTDAIELLHGSLKNAGSVKLARLWREYKSVLGK